MWGVDEGVLLVILAALHCIIAAGAGAADEPVVKGGDLLASIPTPSDLSAKTSKQQKFIDGVGPEPRIKSGRPADSEHCSPIPLALVHEAFAVFSSTLASHGDLESRHYRAAAALMAAMSGSFSNENLRTDAFMRVLGDALGASIQRTQYGRSINTTDGTWLCSGACVLTTEMKELGDPARQNEAYLIEVSGFRADDKGNLTHLRRLLHAEPRLPAFLLDVYGGVVLAVRGAYFAPPSLCTATLATASMIADELHGPSHAHLARTLQALCAASAMLRARYERTGYGLDRAIMPVVGSPAELVRPIPYRGGLIRCERQLMDGRLAFVAKFSASAGGEASEASASAMSLSEALGATSAPAAAASAAPGAAAAVWPWPDEFVVKFARGRYGLEQHLVAAECGCAPRVLGCVPLEGGWKCIAMEHLPVEEWAHFDVRSATAEQAADVLSAYDLVFKQRDYVHGDLRRGNVLVRRSSAGPAGMSVEAADSGLTSASAHAGAGSASASAMAGPQRVQFLDFDWAGQLGKVRYPASLNKQAWEEEGMGDLAGQLIATEDDVAMLTRSEPEPHAKRARRE